jgi:hypothetical protein
MEVPIWHLKEISSKGYCGGTIAIQIGSLKIPHYFVRKNKSRSL